jgi:hypothetical protein
LYNEIFDPQEENLIFRPDRLPEGFGGGGDGVSVDRGLYLPVEFDTKVSKRNLLSVIPSGYIFAEIAFSETENIDEELNILSADGGTSVLLSNAKVNINGLDGAKVQFALTDMDLGSKSYYLLKFTKAGSSVDDSIYAGYSFNYTEGPMREGFIVPKYYDYAKVELLESDGDFDCVVMTNKDKPSQTIELSETLQNVSAFVYTPVFFEVRFMPSNYTYADLLIKFIKE